ncbi:MAG: N-acetylmuramoyl-L-alanine amidase [Massilimicrobiota timonensis]
MSKKVFIGVGHGGSDPGAVANGKKEKDMTLKIAKACNDYLKACGVSTKMSRTKDENDDVNEEVRECNAFNPNLAIDCHINAGGGDGFEAYYTIGGGTGKTLAKNIESYVKSAGQNSRGIKTKKNSSGNDYYAFIRNTKAPAVICELGFVDNKTDLKAFDEDSELKKFGEAYAKGILKTLGMSTSKPSSGGSSNAGTSGSFLIKVANVEKGDVLNIRASASASAKITGKLAYNDPNKYTIVQTKKVGTETWGKLKSGIGWINLRYTKRV